MTDASIDDDDPLLLVGIGQPAAIRRDGNRADPIRRLTLDAGRCTPAPAGLFQQPLAVRVPQDDALAGVRCRYRPALRAGGELFDLHLRLTEFVELRPRAGIKDADEIGVGLSIPAGGNQPLAARRQPQSDHGIGERRNLALRSPRSGIENADRSPFGPGDEQGFPIGGDGQV